MRSVSTEGQAAIERRTSDVFQRCLFGSDELAAW